MQVKGDYSYRPQGQKSKDKAHKPVSPENNAVIPWVKSLLEFIKPVKVLTLGSVHSTCCMFV